LVFVLQALRQRFWTALSVVGVFPLKASSHRFRQKR
jgi:hypothetical protein